MKRASCYLLPLLPLLGINSCKTLEREAVKSTVHAVFFATMTTGADLTHLGNGLYTY